jgi:hypothetical protein
MRTLGNFAAKRERQLDPRLQRWFAGAVRLLVTVALGGLTLMVAWVFLSDDW